MTDKTGEQDWKQSFELGQSRTKSFSKQYRASFWNHNEILFADQEVSLQVCGDIPENAMYVDAVTMKHQTPWYEIKVEFTIIYRYLFYYYEMKVGNSKFKKLQYH